MNLRRKRVISMPPVAEGMIIGISIAAPVGPIGVLCMRRTLARGRAAGFASGLGASVADMAYGCLAAFGLTAVSGAILRYSPWIQLIGGIFLLYLGYRTIRSAPAERAASAEEGGKLALDFASTFALTLANPMTILSFAGVFAGLGVAASSYGFRSALSLVTGVFLGSVCWWLVLSAGVHALRGRLSLRALTAVNRFSGAVLLGFGAVSLYRLLMRL